MRSTSSLKMTSFCSKEPASASSLSRWLDKISFARSYERSINALTSSSMMRAVSSLYGLVKLFSPRLS